MPRGPSTTLPKMGRHRASGQARVFVHGRGFYLGEWGSQEAQDRYDALITTYIESGRKPFADGRIPVTVSELGDMHTAWARAYYVKNGRPTDTSGKVRRALKLLYRAGLAEGSPARFGPRMLKKFQEYLAADQTQRWNRSTINEFVRRIVEMFRWAVGEELLEEGVHRALLTVQPLRKGRPLPGVARAPREPKKVRSVPEESIEKTLTRLGAMVAAMVQVQLLTGMRPAALVHMRPGDLRRTKDARVLAYVVAPEAYKLEHREDVDDTDRTVYIGPKALKILKPWMEGVAPEEFIFSPRRSELARNQERRENRRVKMWKSHDPKRRQKRKGTRPQWGRRYTVDSYRRAINRACEAAGVIPWSPNRLRHNAASYIAAHESLDVAKVILGHRSIETTLIYAEVEPGRAIAAAKRRG